MESPGKRRGLAARVARWATVGLLTLATLAYSGIALYSADVLTRPRNRAIRVEPVSVSPDARPWSTRTDDGLTLRGWHLPTPGRERLVVLVHGMWGSREQMAGLGRDLHALGHDVLLFDLRGHGQSDPSRLFMGRRERADLRAVLAWAEAEGYAPDRIGWLGYSMGAATLLMEAALNPKIRVAVLDSPFGNLPELLDSQLSRHSRLPEIFNPGILLAARLAYGVRTDDIMPLQSARSWGRRPILLIHGEADTTVPVAQARRIAAAIGPSCEAILLPGVEHVEAYSDHRPGYVAAVDRFFREHLHGTANKIQ